MATDKGGNTLRADVSLLVNLGTMLGFLALGLLARHVGLLDERRRERLNTAAFYVVLPALIFTSTYDRALGNLLSAELVVGLWTAYLVVGGGAWLLHRRTRPVATRSVAVVQSYHGNYGFLGLPLVAATLGAAAAGQASVVLGVGALTQTPLTIVTLVALNDADASLRRELRSVVLNPVVVALAVGLAFAATGRSVPDDLARGLSLIAEPALPVALVLVGSALEVHAPNVDPRTLGSVVALKVLAMPAVAWVAFTALGAPPLARNAGVVMLGAPTAVATFVYATELGGDSEFASVGIFTTTVVSVLTLGVVLSLLL